MLTFDTLSPAQQYISMALSGIASLSIFEVIFYTPAIVIGILYAVGMDALSRSSGLTS